MDEVVESMIDGNIREYTRDRLRKDGYNLLLKAMETLEVAEPYETKKHLALDFSHNYKLSIWLKNDEDTKVWYPSNYAEKSSRILIYALYVAIKNKWFEKPVNKFDFNVKVSEECPKISSSNVNFFLGKKWVRKIFEVDDMTDTVKLLFLPKEILGVEELAKQD